MHAQIKQLTARAVLRVRTLSRQHITTRQRSTARRMLFVCMRRDDAVSQRRRHQRQQLKKITTRPHRHCVQQRSHLSVRCAAHEQDVSRRALL
jgi:hypothetical protein